MKADLTEKGKPCAACPWTLKDQATQAADVQRAVKAGAWFCCHVNMGTCYGALAESKRCAQKEPEPCPA